MATVDPHIRREEDHATRVNDDDDGDTKRTCLPALASVSYMS